LSFSPSQDLISPLKSAIQSWLLSTLIEEVIGVLKSSKRILQVTDSKLVISHTLSCFSGQVNLFSSSESKQAEKLEISNSAIT